MAFSSDQPKIRKEQDRFQRYEFSKRIASIVSSNSLENSLVIGLYGKWGEGKTSVLNFIKQELPQECIVINFNPWLFNDQHHLIKSFFNEIAAALKKSITKPKENIGKVLSEYGSLIGNIKFAGFGFSGLNNLGDKWKDVSVEKLKHRVDTIIQESGKKLVICVDDIDRLDVNEIQHIFKLIKLVGDFSNSTYVLAFDDEMVASALAPIYGDGKIQTGYRFLEKIIQVPLIIPKATKTSLIKYTIELTDEVVNKVKIKLTKDEVDNFRTVFDENFAPTINNPRLAIRYANSLFFSLPLLSGEVSIIDLMLVEALKVFYPLAYDFTRMNSSLFLTNNMLEHNKFRHESPNKDTINSEISIFLNNFNGKDKKRVISVWQNLFPQYLYISANQGYADDSWRDWYRAKRICSGKYFERYFTYAVIDGDLSDIFFDQFLKELNYLSKEKAEDKMKTLFDQNRMSEVIFKLRLWEDRMNATQSETLSALLASKGSELPIEKNEFSSYTTRAEGAKIIAQLLFNIEKKHRTSVAIKTFNYTNEIEFAMEISYWLFHKEEKLILKEFTYNDTKRIKDYFVDRFKNTLSGDNFFDLLSDGNLWRMLSWWKVADEDGLKDYIVNTLGNSVERAISLIKVFSATISSWGGPEGQQSYKGGFTQSRYDAMTDIIEPNLIYRILKAADIYQINNVNLQTFDNYDIMTDEDFANIYMQLYENKHTTLGDIQ